MSIVFSPSTLIPQADWARRSQRLEVDPSIFDNVCLPSAQEKGTIPYDFPTKYLSFLNIKSACIDIRHELYGIFFDQTNCGCDSKTNKEKEKESGSCDSDGSALNLLASVTNILAIITQLQKCGVSSNGHEETIAGLLKLIESLQNDNYKDMVDANPSLKQWKAVVELPTTETPPCPSNPFKTIYEKPANASAPQNCVEEFLYGGGIPAIQPASCLPRKVYTNCLYPPGIDPIVITNPIDVAETYEGFVDINPLDNCENVICSKRFIAEELDTEPPANPCCGSGSGSGSDEDKVDLCPVRVAVFDLSEKFQLTLWTTLIQSLVTGCMPWSVLEIPHLDKTLLEFFSDGTGSGSGSGSGSDNYPEILDEFLGRLNYNKILSYGELQYNNVPTSFSVSNADIDAKKFVYGNGPTKCAPFMLPIASCAPLNVFAPPAVENNPLLDLLPTEFWTQLSEYTNGIVKGYPIANETEFIASEMDLIYPLTPLPFTLKIKVEIWLPRPYGFTPVGDNIETIQKNFVSFKEIGINSYLNSKDCCLFDTCF